MNFADQRSNHPDLPASSATGGRPPRSVGRGRSLPSSRALLGSLLVTLAGVGLYLATIRAAEAPMTTYVVAAIDLPPQHPIVASDLRVVTLRFDANLGTHTFRTVADLLKTTTLGPVHRGEFLQPGNVIATLPGSRGREMSFSIDRSRAVDGRLLEGELIDIVATTGSGSSVSTQIVIANALILHLSDSSSTASTDQLTISVAIPDEAAELALSQAIIGAEIIVVRSNASLVDANPAVDGAAAKPGVQR
jgi:Flp pilus assembly protein CpaB